MNIYSKRLPTIKQLQYFLAVSEENNFRKAAIKLGISQPPLSIQIQALEAKLGVDLFLRNTQGVILTKDGEIFKERANQLLLELSLMADLFKSEPSQQIIVGMTNTVNFNSVPVVSRFMSHFANNLSIEQHNYNSKQLVIELLKGHIDFAIISDDPAKKGQGYSKMIHQEPLSLVLPADHPACCNEYIDLNDVTDLPLYWFNRHQHPVFYDQCEQVFRQLACPLRRRAELADTLSMLLDISLGNAMLLLPLSMAQANIPGVAYKRLLPNYDIPLAIHIYLTWQQHTLQKKLAIEVIQFFND